MLSKLLKHEFKATARLLLPLYLVLFVLTIVDRLVLSLELKGTLGLITGFATFAYVISILAIAVVSFVIIISRFYKNLLTDEGYLMFTLPVKPHQLINSKIIVSFVWNIVSVLLILLSLFALFITKERFRLFVDGFDMIIAEIRLEFGAANMTLFIIEFIALMVLGIINGILMIYVSIAVGQLFNGHKVLGSFAAYIGINTVLQILVSVALVLLGFMFKTSLDDARAVPQIVFPLSIAYTLITNVLFYFGTNIIFKKKLNLE
ncbi:MAG: putative rane protein [Herbinix sp.]|jgi:hypothetical protein|nr:putative rane protein [Herbinix sp.]